MDPSFPCISSYFCLCISPSGTMYSSPAGPVMLHTSTSSSGSPPRGGGGCGCGRPYPLPPLSADATCGQDLLSSPPLSASASFISPHRKRRKRFKYSRDLRLLVLC